jgi:hypothetical protein
MPVLPLVASMTVWPGRNDPSRSACWITLSAMRSFTEAMGLNDSTLTNMSMPGGASRLILTIGVLPMVSRMLLQ